MTLFALPLALLVAVGVGIVVGRHTGWRLALSAAFLTLLISGGIYVGLVMLIVSSMD